MERLCQSGLLEKMSSQYGSSVVIASLPDGIKDPADFMEARKSMSEETATAAFHKEVLETAVDWVTWMIDRILLSMDPTEIKTSGPGSFTDVCEQLSNFLSGLNSAPERTRRAHDVATKLASIVTEASVGDGTASNALRIQLESDLVNMVARKASRKAAISKRVEAVEGYNDATNKAIVTKLLAGGDTDDIGESDFSIRKAPSTQKSKRSDISSPTGNMEQRHEGRQSRRKRTTMVRRWQQEQKEKPIVPHFDGFKFESKEDEEWLGIRQTKVQ